MKYPIERYTVDVKFTSEDLLGYDPTHEVLSTLIDMQGTYDIREYVQCYEIDVYWTSFVAIGKEHEIPFAGASNWNPHDGFDANLGIKIALKRAVDSMLIPQYEKREFYMQDRIILRKIITKKFRTLRWEKFNSKEVKNE